MPPPLMRRRAKLRYRTVSRLTPASEPSMRRTASGHVGAWTPYAGTGRDCGPKKTWKSTAPRIACVHLGMVVDEMRQPQRLAVGALVRPRPAEPHVVTRHAGPPVEVMRVQPAKRPALDAPPTLGHQPHAPAE